MTSLLLDPDAWVALLTLTALELVLGIDNVIFISILVDRLPPARREVARRTGLFLAMFMRIALLFLLARLIGFTQPLIAVAGHEISGRDLVLIGGGLFLLWKSTSEIHQLLEGREGSAAGDGPVSFVAVIAQVIVVDVVFSLDSIVTAVGMVDQIEVMVAAVVASVLLMLAFAGAVGRFVSAHPTVKMLALAFLFVVGVVLIADGFEHHIPKGYVYFAMAFSMVVESLNIRMRRRGTAPVNLREPYGRDNEQPRMHRRTRAPGSRVNATRDAARGTLVAAALYFAAVFGAGFVLGPIRMLWAEPRFGPRLAELIEAPIMLVVIVVAARWIVGSYARQFPVRRRVTLGVVALLLMLVAEFALVTWLRGESIGNYFAGRDPVSGSVYYVLLVVFAAMPALLRRR